MSAYLQVYDSHHLQADCQELGSAVEPYARQSSTGYLYLLSHRTWSACHSQVYVVMPEPESLHIEAVRVELSQ